MLGETFSVDIHVDNSSTTSIGYNPWVELLLPPLPGTNLPAFSLSSAQYLGRNIVTQNLGTIPEEGSITNPLTGMPISGPVGSTVVLLDLPISSIAPNQPPALLELELAMSAETPIASQPISARGLFLFGEDHTGQSPPVLGPTLTDTTMPTILQARKRTTFPENETATGPSFPGTWILAGDVAAGATLENVTLTDNLPDNFHVLSANVIKPAGGSLSLTGSNPDRAVNVTWPSVAGSVGDEDIRVEVTGYVPEFDASGAPVLSPASGEGRSPNQFAITSTFERPGIEPAGGIPMNATSNTLVLDDLSLAIQKSVSLAIDTLPVGPSPGDTLQYTFAIQVSDFKTVGDLRIDEQALTSAGLAPDGDILGDGLTFDANYRPRYSAVMGGQAVSGTFYTDHFTVTPNPNGHPTGSSRIAFELSEQLMAENHFEDDGILTGAHRLSPIAGSGTTASITFRATIDTTFDSPASGDASVDLTDWLRNTVDIAGYDHEDEIRVGDESGADIQIVAPASTYVIERVVTVEGETFDRPTTPQISPGDTVTFSQRVQLPTGDIEDFRLDTFLPYSLLRVDDVNGDGTAGDTLGFTPHTTAYPPVGQLHYGPADEYHLAFPNAPSFGSSALNNAFSLDFGDIDTVGNDGVDGDGIYELELRFTLVAGDDNYPDGFEMTSLLQLTHDSTNGDTGDQREYVGFLFSRPVLEITKGVVSSSRSGASPSPAASGLFDAAGSDGDLSPATGEDRVTFAITVQNTGSDHASRLTLRDELPAGFDPATFEILSINRADGQPMIMIPALDAAPNSADEAALLGAGWTVNSSATDNYLHAQSTPAAGPPFANDTLVLTCAARLRLEQTPGAALVNTAYAELYWADGLPADGPADTVSDPATVRIENVGVVKTVVTGQPGDFAETTLETIGEVSMLRATIGEVLTFDIAVDVPEGRLDNLVVTDLFPNGMVPFAVNGVTARVLSTDPDLVGNQLAVGDTDVSSSRITVGSDRITFDVGDVVHADDSDDRAGFVVRVHALLQDQSSNRHGKTIQNRALTTWTGGSSEGLAPVRIVRPNPTIEKAMHRFDGEGLPVEGGDYMKITLDASNPGGAKATSTSYDTEVVDVIDPEIFKLDTIWADPAPAGWTVAFATLAEGLEVRFAKAGPMARGETASFTIYGNVRDDIPVPSTLVNTATISGHSLPTGELSGVRSTDTDSDTGEAETAGPRAHKTLQSTSEATTPATAEGAGVNRFAIGERLVYRISADIPEGKYTGLTFTDFLPVGLDFVGANPAADLAFPGTGYRLGGAQAELMGSVMLGVDDTDPTPLSSTTPDGSGRDISFQFGAFENAPDGNWSNDTFWVEFECVVVDDSAVTGLDNPSSLDNRARVYTPETASGEGFTEVVPAKAVEPRFVIDKLMAQDAADPERVLVTLRCWNTGEAPAYGAAFEDVLSEDFDSSFAETIEMPAGYTFGFSNGVVAITSSSDTVFPVLGYVEARFALRLAPAAEVPVRNTARVHAATTVDSEPADGSDLPRRTVPEASATRELFLPDVVAFKNGRVQRGALLPGGTIRYVIDVHNFGTADATQVDLQDPIPANTTIVPGSATVDGAPLPDPTNGILQVALGTLTPLASARVAFEVMVDEPLAAGVTQIVNRATVGFAERSHRVVADNDPTGHDTTTDDGLDDDTDPDADTANDDPTVLPVLRDPEIVYIAFEDLKNAGFNDYDYNDLVLKVTTFRQMAGDGVAAMTILYEALARGAGFQHEAYLTLNHGGAAQHTITRFHLDGTIVSSDAGAGTGESTMLIYPRTWSAIEPAPDNQIWEFSANTEPGTTRIGGRITRIDISFDDAAANPLSGFDAAPFDTWIRVQQTNQDIHRRDYAVGDVQIVTEGPLLGRELPFAHVFSNGYNWAADSVPVWEAHPDYEDFIRSGMNEPEDWWVGGVSGKIWADTTGDTGPVGARRSQGGEKGSRPTPGGQAAGWPVDLGAGVFASPTLCDIDGDGSMELLVGSQDGKVHVRQADGTPRAGWPQNTAVLLRGVPSAGDLDGDGMLEVLVGDNQGQLHAWHADGIMVAGFPIGIGAPIKSMPSVVDLDGDDAPEILFHGGDSRLHVRQSDGAARSGWPQTLAGDPDLFGQWVMGSSPAVLQADDDAELEIAISSEGGMVYLFNHDGSEVSGWPQSTESTFIASVVVAELAGGGRPELVAAGGDGRVYAWHLDGSPVAGFPVELPANIVGSPAVADLDADGRLDMIVSDMAGAVHGIAASGEAVLGWPQTTGSEILASPVVLDVDGDGKLDVVVGSKDNRLHAWNAGGSALAGFPADLGDWITGSASAADVDGDGDLELCAAAFDGRVHLLDLRSTNAPAWARFQNRTHGAPLGDTDQDGMDDTLERLLFGTLDRDGQGDLDGDGASDGSEYNAGTNPNDGSDRLRIAMVRPMPEQALKLEWEGRATRRYRVLFSDALRAGAPWQHLQDVDAFGDGMLDVVDPDGGDVRFYRVELR